MFSASSLIVTALLKLLIKTVIKIFCILLSCNYDLKASFDIANNPIMLTRKNLPWSNNEAPWDICLLQFNTSQLVLCPDPHYNLNYCFFLAKTRNLCVIYNNNNNDRKFFDLQVANSPKKYACGVFIFVAIYYSSNFFL